MRSGAAALRILAADPKHLGADIGVIAVLHTWGQSLQHHPHVHTIVPGGGLCVDRSRWIAGRSTFFLPVKMLSALFQRLFLKELNKAYQDGRLKFFADLAALADAAVFARYLARLRGCKWVVFAKPPFGGPEQVLAYLSRYTHRVAIANSRSPPPCSPVADGSPPPGRRRPLLPTPPLAAAKCACPAPCRPSRRAA